MVSRLHSYAYDAAGRLTDHAVYGEGVSHYDYDDNGNRTAHVSDLGVVVGRYDARDRLERYCPEDGLGNAVPTAGLPCLQHTYAASGQLLSKTDLANPGVTLYDYDEVGSLRSVELPDGRQVEYELDAKGRRVGKWVDGQRQWGLLYLGQLRPVAELDASGAVRSVFVYATRANVPDYMVRAGVVYRFVTNHLGSVHMVVRVPDGAVVQRVEYDEFGSVTIDTSPGFQPFGFAGGIYDPETSLVRFGARDYDPVTGRWTAKDPIGFAGGDTNLYAYVGGDPVNFIDPTGLLTVHYWRGQAGDRGHASITLDDGTYISYWPSTDAESFSWYEKAPPDLGRTYGDDYLGEGRRKSWDIRIDGLNEAAIKKWWNEGKGHGDFSAFNNCSDIALEALRQGGLNVSDPFLADPEGVLQEAIKWSDLHSRGYIWGEP